MYTDDQLTTFREAWKKKAIENNTAVVIVCLPDKCIDCKNLNKFIESTCSLYDIHLVKVPFKASKLILEAFKVDIDVINIIAISQKGKITAINSFSSGARGPIFDIIYSAKDTKRDLFEKMIGLFLTLRDSYVNFTMGKNVFADEDLIKKRLDICFSCPRYNKKQKRCNDCGCFVIPKTKLQASFCPQNKW